jgi:hypothetical protein
MNGLTAQPDKDGTTPEALQSCAAPDIADVSSHSDTQYLNGDFANSLEAARLAWLRAMSGHKKQFGVIEFPPYPFLTAEHLRHCTVVPFRDDIIEAMPKGGKIVELGVQAGDFSRDLLNLCQPAELHLIDLHLTKFGIAEKFAPEIASGQVVLHEGDSSTLIASFPDGYFDLVYVDADHGYDGVSLDIKASEPKVADNGYFLFNDYTFWSPTECTHYGVIQAVNELCLEKGWEFTHFALGLFGYSDVALRRVQPPKPRSPLSRFLKLIAKSAPRLVGTPKIRM